ncbi:MAG: SDR family NAD(P)-dependent oxidoreductase [Okeania sp. SIO3B5]|uniref:type I polyketide synthase n=1 Tax=Okeania sp. SIO3B5 TaxID=2607811 RepID=UPI0013FEF152|nr:type I polyketide synthase [Okeania sp. SIO3B5]NEO53141.1 SDR family NAD(P)-dependent oxidoreductase [Okeania sp. SIO3B5]
MANLNLNLDLVEGNSDVVQLVELGNGVVQIAMQDKENCNIFSPGIIEGLYKCFGAVAQNQSYKVVILTGYGNYFCSGGTKEQLISIWKGDSKCNDLDFFRIALDCEIPVIAAMQGHSIGGGLVLGLYADLVVLSQESIYTTNFMKYGFTPGVGCTLILPEKFGALGFEMMYTAQNYRGKELAERGVSFPVVPRKDVLEVAKKIAYEMSEKPRLSLITLKEHLTSKIRKTLPGFIDKEVAMHEITFHQPEVASRIEEHFDKRTTASNNPQNFPQEAVRKEIRTDSLNCQPFQLKTFSYGSLNNLTLVPLERRVPSPSEVEVQIKTVPVNFRDILNALGMLQEYYEKTFGIANAEDLTFGFEGAGTIVAVGAEVSQWQVGDEVMVMRIHDAFSSFIICSPDKLVRKNFNLNMEDGASIWGPFLTAYHGLINLAKIQPGDRVLIHAASGGIGQAAIQLVQLFGAEVFATTSPGKMNYLREQGIKYVMNSRTMEFVNDVMEFTQGRGVDVILNSLTHGEYIQKNIEILADRGRYVELGKLGIWSHEQVYQKRPDIKYFTFDLLEEFAKDNQLFYQIWDNLSLEFDRERLKPLPYKTFPIEDVIKAFDYMRRGKHFGRVVVVMPDSYSGKEKELDARLSIENKMTKEEQILFQLQSGEVSLENAEQLLLGNTETETQEKAIAENQIDNIQNKLINMDSSEKILSLISSGEISLETAEKLLLEVVEPEVKTEVNDEVNPSQNHIPTTDIAIIGMSCRYPGANNWKEFWENLKNGIDSVTEAPPGRWEEKNWYHPDPDNPGTSYSKCAGFLDEIDKFDPLFFHISPEEAWFMEPEQRIFLEEAYHAIEDAGYATDSLRGKQYGVFVGVTVNGGYLKLLSISGLDVHRMAATGNGPSMIPARIAYMLDLQGPVVAIDTACSSSLVAVHQACQSIQRGESEIAIAGGITLMPTSDFQIMSSQFQVVSPDGRCKTFDASASGTAWSEGCGVLLLKSYSQAIQDNDHIYGVIKGTGVNYDGNTNGISAPSSQSQASLEEAVYQKFGINPETISYVEAHGTATPLGDPIEVEALTEAFSKWTNKKQFCAIGSVKTNIGHSAAAAGVSGLIKTILCLKNQKLVPSLHFNQPNPHIDFENSPFYVNTKLKDWEVLEGQPRQATVSSFGFSGTNAHIVIEEAPSQVKSQNIVERPIHLLTLSAKTEKALEDLVSNYQNYLETNPELPLADVCYTASTGRAHFNYRLGVIASEPKALIEKLLGWKAQEELVGLFSGKRNSEGHKIAFLFTGQGSQYANMGRQLYEKAPTFRQALEECDQILQPYLEVPLLEVIYSEDAQKSSDNLLDQTAYTQPAIFALEYALFKLWDSWGIKPNVVMGHSVGEYVAACIAGVFSLEDGLKLIAMRGKLMQKLPSGGEMVSVMASESQVTEAIKEYSSQVTIAAINGPESIVISGESVAIRNICSLFESEGIKTKQLQVSHAFHSPMMEPMLAEFESVAKQVTYNQPQIPLISNVTGTEVDGEITNAEYWVDHVRQPVRFAQSMKTLESEGYETFLEIGPRPILLGMGRQCVTEDVGEWLPSLRPGVDEWEQMLSSLGKLYVKGAKIDWSGFDSDYTRQKVVLPTYPFQGERYWVETNNNFWLQRQFSQGENLHPLLGQKLNCAGEQKIFASQIGENSPNYLRDHRVFNQALFPITGYLEIAIAAGNHQLKTSFIVIEDLTITRGWILPTGELTNAQTILTPIDNQSYNFQIFSQPEQQEWRLHTTGKIRKESTPPTQTKVDLEKYKSECNQTIEVKQHYQKCQQVGIDYGNTFQGIQELWSGSNQALGYIKLPEELITQIIDYHLHPALLDAALQVMFYALPATDNDKTYLSAGIEEFRLYKTPGLSLWAYASVTSQEVETPESLTAIVTIVTPEGEIIANLKGLQVKLATKQTLLRTETESIENLLYEVEWRNKGIFGKLLPPDFLIPPIQINQKLTPTLTELVTQVDNETTASFETSLEELSRDYIVQALQSMSWSYKPTESFAFDVAAQKLGIVPTHRPLFKRLLQILTESGILNSKNQQWEVSQTLAEVKPTEKISSLQKKYPEETAALTLLSRCGSKLSGVLRGAIDPVELVFPQGDLTAATQLYEDSTVAKVMNTIVERTITKAIEKLPKSRGIRLLEIGGGTGGTTSYILPHLTPQQTEYTFTDIGALFTTKAQEKFRDYKFIKYQTLDIEVDPTTQGFEAHQYDVIIAANVLHATTDMKQTLSHVRELLADGGMLVLSEATAKTIWIDLVFGLLEGWWKFRDYELRPDYPLLSREKWHHVLRETGFTEVVTMPEVEGMAETLSAQTVIVAKSSQRKLEQRNDDSKSWLILADKKGVGQQLATVLRSVGEVCTLVFAGERYQQIAPGEFTINPNQAKDFEEVIETVALKSPSLYGVVQCWTTEAGVGNGINSEELGSLSKLGCGTTLSLVQALVKGGLSTVPRLWLVTNGAQAVPNNHPVIPGVAQSSVWGMGKVISWEHPELNCTRIDLDPEETLEGKVDGLFKEIWSEDREDQVAWRGDSRYVARLVGSHHRQLVAQQADGKSQKPLSFRSEASYLITGGMGGLGLLVANWMVSKGAKHLILLGRRSPDDATRKKITELEMAGASVVVEKADVTDLESMKGVLQRIEESNRPLVGVIHSVMVLSNGVLRNQTWSSFEQVMEPKVQGAWHLHQLTQSQPLDFFVLFSSATSLLGSLGQGMANYSAANGFLDGLAHYRRTMGLPGLSIHWGPVSQVGRALGRDTETAAMLSKNGMGLISPAQVLESLELLMSSSDVEVGVMPIEWSGWQERVAQWPFLVDWQETILEVAQPSKSDFLLKLEATPPNELRLLLVAHVRRQVAQVLRISHPESIEMDTGFFDLGIDSLTSVELRNKLQGSLKCSVPSTVTLDYPTIKALVEYLYEQLLLEQVSYSNTVPTEEINEDREEITL